MFKCAKICNCCCESYEWQLRWRDVEHSAQNNSYSSISYK